MEQSQPMHRGNKPCYRCGKTDTPNDCKYQDFVCRNCSKKGHLARVCQSRRAQPEHKSVKGRNSTTTTAGAEGKSNWIETSNSTTGSDPLELKTDEAIFCIKETTTRSLPVDLELNNIMIVVPFEVDTGAAVTIMSNSLFKQYLPHQKLNSTQIKL